MNDVSTFCSAICTSAFHILVINSDVKFRMEMGNVSKIPAQQPDHITDNNRRSPIGPQCSEKFPYPEASFSWPLNKYILVQ